MRWSKVCELEDFRQAEVAAMIRWLEPELAATCPAHPCGREHRKSWEQQQMLRGSAEFGALHAGATVLVIHAGVERLIYALTHFADEVFAVDDYSSAPGPLLHPRSFAPFDYHSRRLRMEHASAGILEFEDGTFDAVYFLRFSSCPTVESGAAFLLEAARVVKRGGVMVLVADMVIDGGPPVGLPGSLLHSPASIERLVELTPALRLAEPVCAEAGAETLAQCRDWNTVVQESLRGQIDYPHIAFEHNGRRFTSATVFLLRP